MFCNTSYVFNGSLIEGLPPVEVNKNMKNVEIPKFIKNTIDNLNKKVIELEAKVESWRERVNDIVDFISERVKGFFGNILKSKYKDIADDLRENNIITEKEYNKIYDLPIRKDPKEDKKRNNDLEL